MTNPVRKAWPRLRRTAWSAALLVCVIFGYGISGHDEAEFRSFDEAVDRWQTNPEFRTIALDYTIRGSAAMRTQPFGIATRRSIMALRSVPGLPKEYAVNPTSRLHYENFSKGPLCAYLHLCSEQSVPDVIGLVEVEGRKSSPTPGDLGELLDAFKMDFPVVKDGGALRSAASLLADVDAGRPFKVRVNVGPALGPHISSLAGELGLSGDPIAMTPDQQQAVLDRLDGYVRRHDPELWRTKQVSDFCGGVWAQVFGPPYTKLVGPVLRIHAGARILVLVLLIFPWVVQRRRTWKTPPTPQAETGGNAKARTDISV